MTPRAGTSASAPVCIPVSLAPVSCAALLSPLTTGSSLVESCEFYFVYVRSCSQTAISSVRGRCVGSEFLLLVSSGERVGARGGGHSLQVFGVLGDEFERFGFGDDVDARNLVLVRDSEDLVAGLHKLWAECGGDELRALRDARPRLRRDEARHRRAVLLVERRVDLVKEVEGRGVAALDGEDEGERHHRLLPARELLHDLRVAASERDADLDADVLFDAPALLAFTGGVLGVAAAAASFGRLLVREALLLHHELPLAVGDELRKDVAKIFRHLLEGALDRLVLALVQHLDHLVDLVVVGLHLRDAQLEVVALLRKAAVLVERLFVDVAKLFDLRVALAERGVELLDALLAVLVEGVRWERAELSDAAHDVVLLLREDLALRDEAVHLLALVLETPLLRLLRPPQLVRLGPQGLHLARRLLALVLEPLEPSLRLLDGALRARRLRPALRERRLRLGRLGGGGALLQLLLAQQQVAVEANLERLVPRLHLEFGSGGCRELGGETVEAGVELRQPRALRVGERGHEVSALFSAVVRDGGFHLFDARADGGELRLLRLEARALRLELFARRLELHLELLRALLRVRAARVLLRELPNHLRNLLIERLELLLDLLRLGLHRRLVNRALADLSHQREAAPRYVVEPAGDGTALVHLVAVDRDAVEARVARHRRRHVDVAADERFPKDLRHRGAEALVKPETAQERNGVLGLWVLNLLRGEAVER
mmetsp:Transcript_13161/g.43399  ORF Transcript_13161/g.43399 Transcript_13161/m.43399 type:complete len:719 (+) Transcript_13161:1846-4002(+)